MPSCKNCGGFTKYINGLCYSCYSRKKEGKVYMAKVKFASGKSTIYTGQTKNSVYKRIGQHMENQNKGNKKTYTGRGTSISLIGSIFSKNRFKAEKTIKKLPREEKVGLARKGAKKVRKSWFSF